MALKQAGAGKERQPGEQQYSHGPRLPGRGRRAGPDVPDGACGSGIELLYFRGRPVLPDTRTGRGRPLHAGKRRGAKDIPVGAMHGGDGRTDSGGAMAGSLGCAGCLPSGCGLHSPVPVSVMVGMEGAVEMSGPGAGGAGAFGVPDSDTQKVPIHG